MGISAIFIFQDHTSCIIAKLITQLIFKLTKTLKLEFDPTIVFQQRSNSFRFDYTKEEFIEEVYVGRYPHRNPLAYRNFETDLINCITTFLHSYSSVTRMNSIPHFVINEHHGQHNFLSRNKLLDWNYQKVLLMGVNFEVSVANIRDKKISYKINNGKWFHIAIDSGRYPLPSELRLPYICQTHTRPCNCDKNFHFLWNGLKKL